MTRFAANQRAYRQRLARGCRVLRVEVPEDRLVDVLVDLKLLDPTRADDLEALRRGLQQLVRLQLGVTDNATM